MTVRPEPILLKYTVLTVVIRTLFVDFVLSKVDVAVTVVVSDCPFSDALCGTKILTIILYVESAAIEPVAVIAPALISPASRTPLLFASW